MDERTLWQKFKDELGTLIGYGILAGIIVLIIFILG